jgi:osmotically-inducible protein OsmY
MTQKIRQALMDDKDLSTYAHNVKVISQDGHVTLKGPVRSQNEKKTVEAKAVEVAGTGHVTNQISIAPSKKSKK